MKETVYNLLDSLAKVIRIEFILILSVVGLIVNILIDAKPEDMQAIANFSETYSNIILQYGYTIILVIIGLYSFRMLISSQQVGTKVGSIVVSIILAVVLLSFIATDSTYETINELIVKYLPKLSISLVTIQLAVMTVLVLVIDSIITITKLNDTYIGMSTEVVRSDSDIINMAYTIALKYSQDDDRKFRKLATDENCLSIINKYR